MNIKIINLMDKLNEEYGIYSDLVFFKDQIDYQYLYIPNYKGVMYIFKYIESEDYLKIESFIQLPSEIRENDIYLIDINERRKEVYFLAYIEKDGRIYMNIYRYSQLSEYIDLISSSEFDDVIHLNDDYAILTCEHLENEFYLLDYRDTSTTKFESEGLELIKTHLDKLKIVNYDGISYLLHVKYYYDEYDIDEYFYKKDKDIEKSGIYFIDFIDFIEQINIKGKVKFEILKENKENSYIFPLETCEESFWDEYKPKYYFYEIDFKTRNINIYLLKLFEKELIYELVHSQSLEDLDDFYNFYVEANPLRIYKFNNSGSLKVLYPNEDIIFHSERESYIKELGKYRVFDFWNENKDSSVYYSGIRIRDKKTNNLFLEVIGKTYFLKNKSILIYNDSFIKTETIIYEDNSHEFTSLNQIFDDFNDTYTQYNWLLNNLKFHEKSKNVFSDSLIISGVELYNLIKDNCYDIISADIIGFSDKINEEHIKEYIDVSYDTDNYIYNQNSIQNELGLIEILISDSNKVIIRSDEEEIIRCYLSNNDKAIRFEEYVKLKKEIKNEN